MYYSQLILTRKGPLGKIWIAAHFDKKLTKHQIFSTDITASVQSILNPSSPLALKVSGHLMLGIVRIYSKKVKYLMTDCTEAMWKMKLAFRPGKVDIDPQAVQMNVDDTRHFGHITTEYDFPMFENVAFASQLMPTSDDSFSGIGSDSNISKRSGQSISTTDSLFFPGRVSDIEFVRGEPTRTSILSHGTSFDSQSLKQSSSMLGGTKFEDDLPGFQMERSEEGLFSDLKFDDYFQRSFQDPSLSRIQEEGGEFIGPEVGMPFDMKHMDTSFDQSSSLEMESFESKLRDKKPIVEVEEEKVKMDIVREGEELEEEIRGERSPVRKRIKTKHIIDDRIEISERTIRQRILDPTPILRRNFNDILPFELGLNTHINENVIGPYDILSYTNTANSYQLYHLTDMMRKNNLYPYQRGKFKEIFDAGSYEFFNVEYKGKKDEKSKRKSSLMNESDIEMARLDEISRETEGEKRLSYMNEFPDTSTENLFQQMDTSYKDLEMMNMDENYFLQEGSRQNLWIPQEREKIRESLGIVDEMNRLFQPSKNRAEVLTTGDQSGINLASERTKEMLKLIEKQLIDKVK